MASELVKYRTRRHFFQECGTGIGAIGLASLLNDKLFAAAIAEDPMAPRKPHFAPKAKRVIYLNMSGGPSQLELLDRKSVV